MQPAVTLNQRPQRRYPIRGADRVYAGIRWALWLIALVITTTNSDWAGIWPLPPSTNFGWAIWTFMLFAVLATIAIIDPTWSRVVPLLYLGDLIGTAVLALTSTAVPDVYQSLFLLPLVAVAFRFERRNILLFTLIAVGLEAGLLLYDGTRTVTDYITRISTLIVLPWFVSFLSEQWSADNRATVFQAEQESATALREAEQYRDRTHALYEVAYALSTSANAAHVLDTTLSESVRLLPHQASAILLPTGQRDEVAVAASKSLTSKEREVRLVVGRGALGLILRGAEGGILPEASKQEELRALPSLTGCTAILAVPLRAGLRTYGLALLGLTEAQPTAEQLEMATALFSYGLVALQNAHLSEELRTQRNRLLLREEETRHQLTRDLHDGPAQALAAITMNLAFIKRLHEREPERVVAEIDKLAIIATRANHDVRTLLFELRPLILETQGLIPTLKQYIERFKDQPTEVIVEGDEEVAHKLSKRVQGTLFNIVQEAVNNALKHAKAQHLWIRLQPMGEYAELVIQDDGCGFDLRAVQSTYDQRGSFGLLSIEERAHLVNGTADLLSVPGAGTTVKVHVAYEEMEAVLAA